MALSRIFAMAMGLAGALGASQGPEFAQQYTQRLGGAIEELETVVARFDEGAAAFGLGRDDAIVRLERNADDLARAQGENARLAAERLAALQEQRVRLESAGDLARVVTLVRVADPQIARGTYEIYRPAVPVTVEGVIAAVLGFMALWALAFGGAKSAKFAGRKGMEAARARFAKARTPPVGEPKRASAPPRGAGDGDPGRPLIDGGRIDEKRIAPFNAADGRGKRIYRRDDG